MCLVLWAAGVQAAEKLPVLYAVPEFSLVDQNNAKKNLASFKGKILVVDFIFTSCGHECPLMMSKMKTLQTHLKDVEPLHFVSITTDHKTDTPKVLKAYAKEHKADEKNWSFLTGDGKAIVDLASKGFKLPASVGSVNHTQKFILVDQTGQVRAYYDSESADEMKSLEKAVRSL